MGTPIIIHDNPPNPSPNPLPVIGIGLGAEYAECYNEGNLHKASSGDCRKVVDGLM